jgi:hypothetical protein
MKLNTGSSDAEGVLRESHGQVCEESKHDRGNARDGSSSGDKVTLYVYLSLSVSVFAGYNSLITHLASTV